MKLQHVAILLLGISGAACNSEAKKQASELVDSLYVHCGDSVYYGGGNYSVEFKGFTWSLEADELTEADRLNGVQFRGKAIYRYSARRVASPGGSRGECWGPWRNSDDSYSAGQIEKINDVWHSSENGQSAPCGEFKIPECGSQ